MAKKIKPLFNELPPIKAPEEEISMSYEEIEKWFSGVNKEMDKKRKDIIYCEGGALFQAMFDRMMKQDCYRSLFENCKEEYVDQVNDLIENCQFALLDQLLKTCVDD